MIRSRRIKLIYAYPSFSAFLTGVLIVFFVLINPVQADTVIVEKIINAIEKTYSQKSFTANFTQVSKLAALEIEETAFGLASFSHPGKMKWEYLLPDQHEIITNGKMLWIYRPHENQVMRGDAAAFFKAGSGGAFLSDIAIIRKNYAVKLKKITKEYTEIDLLPQKENDEISAITIQILQKNNHIKRVVTCNAFDDMTMIEFSNVKFISFAPNFFEFKPDKKLNIIDMHPM